MRLALVGGWLLCTAALLLSPMTLAADLATSAVVGLLLGVAGLLWRLDEKHEWTDQDQTAYEVYTEWMSER